MVKSLFRFYQLSLQQRLKENMSQNFNEGENKKSARFSSIKEVFNYTAQKTEDEDNSLLLTPKEFKSLEDENLLSQRRSKNKEISANRRDHKEVQLKRKSLAEKKQSFKRRLSTFPANSKENEQIKNQQAMILNQVGGAIQSIFHNNQSKIAVHQQRQMKQVDNKVKVLQKQQKGNEPMNSAEQKTKMASYSQPSENNPGIAKMDIEENNDLSTQNIKVTKNLQKNSRITMDYHSFLLQLGVYNQHNDIKQKKSQQSENSKNKTDINIDVNNQPQTLVSKAIRRLSEEGKRVSMMKKKNRVTLNFNEIQSVLSQFEPNDILIKSLRKQADERHNIHVKQKEKQNERVRRQFLEKYFDEEELRQNIMRHSLQKTRFDRQRLLSNLKRLDDIQNQLDEQIRLKKIESNQNIKKIETLQRNRYKPEQVEQLLMPKQYLYRVYSVNIVQIMSRSQGPLSQSRNYQIKFIIDEFLYCKIICNQGENKSLVIPIPIDFEKRTSNWSLDLKLRVQLLRKYFQKNLQDCEPVPTIMRLGIFWQSLQKIESDFQMIDQFFQLLQLNLDECKDQLSFRMELSYNNMVDVRVNFMKVDKDGYFQIDNQKQIVLSKGKKIQLLQFLTEYIASMKF